MKIALCFSGLIKDNVEEVFEYYATSILPHYNIDIYAGLWKNEELQTEKNLSKFTKLFKPKLVEIEEFKSFEKSTLDILKQNIITPENFLCWPFNSVKNATFISMWYKIWRANLLSKKFNIKYDVVIRARTDTTYNSLFFDFFDGLTIPKGDTHWSDFPDLKGINDVFAFGPPKYIDYYSTLIFYLFSYLNEGVHAIPAELLLTYHLSKKSILLRRTNTEIIVNRDNFYNKHIDKGDFLIYNTKQDFSFNENNKFLIWNEKI